MTNLVHRIIIWMRQWNIKQRKFEQLEAHAKRNREALVLGMGALVTIGIIIIGFLRGSITW